jgi:hypothetical protein
MVAFWESVSSRKRPRLSEVPTDTRSSSTVCVKSWQDLVLAAELAARDLSYFRRKFSLISVWSAPDNSSLNRDQARCTPPSIVLGNRDRIRIPPRARTPGPCSFVVGPAAGAPRRHDPTQQRVQDPSLGPRTEDASSPQRSPSHRRSVVGTSWAPERRVKTTGDGRDPQARPHH